MVKFTEMLRFIGSREVIDSGRSNIEEIAKLLIEFGADVCAHSITWNDLHKKVNETKREFHENFLLKPLFR